MKRFLLPLIAISIALISCSRDNDDFTNPIENPIAQAKKLTKITRNFDNFGHSGGGAPFLGTEFEYNGDLLKNIFYYGEQVYHYNGEQISAIEIVSGSRPQKIEFIYNPDGTLKSSFQKFDTGGTTTDRTTSREYHYINANTIKVKEVLKWTDSNSEIKTEYTLTMNGDNLVRKEIFNEENSRTQIHQYTYDNKKNPLREVKGMAALSVAMHLMDFHFHDMYNFQISSFKNNILSETIDEKYTYSSTTSRLAEIDYQYQYNQEGYPTRVIHSYYDIQSQWNEKAEYIYNYQ